MVSNYTMHIVMKPSHLLGHVLGVDAASSLSITEKREDICSIFSACVCISHVVIVDVWNWRHRHEVGIIHVPGLLATEVDLPKAAGQT